MNILKTDIANPRIASAMMTAVKAGAVFGLGMLAGSYLNSLTKDTPRFCCDCSQVCSANNRYK